MPDETCRAFDQVAAGDPQALHRFVVGVDTAPQKMTAAEVKALGDPFATLLLAKGTFPDSGEELVDRMRAAVPKGNALNEFRSFLVGEGSQLPVAEADDAGGSLRFITTLGRGPDGPDVFVSVGDPKQSGGIEVMAWRRGSGGFNYYRSTGSPAMWMFAGNSRDALLPDSRGKGPFESHPSGSLLMKELKEPWQNWHSPLANVSVNAFPKGDPRRKHEWFTKRDPGGAYTLEFGAARPAITRWARLRLAPLRKEGGTVDRPGQIMEQVLGTPTANLITSFHESRGLPDGDAVDLPATFFVDADALAGVGLTFPPFFSVKGKLYKRSVEKFGVRLESPGIEQKGDTHFCFLVPERAFEDQEILREAIAAGLLTKRLAACLLMVDPWNPVYSKRREALLAHVPASATITDRRSTFSRDMAASIVAAAEQAGPGSPEAEFAERWQVGAAYKGPFNRLLRPYFAAINAKLRTQAGFDAYYQLAHERREHFRTATPIGSEFDLLLPRANIPIKGRRMKADGTVGRG